MTLKQDLQDAEEDLKDSMDYLATAREDAEQALKWVERRQLDVHESEQRVLKLRREINDWEGKKLAIKHL